MRLRTPFWGEAHLEIKMCKTHQLFWKFRCRKSARGCGAKYIPSQHVQNTLFSEHFWKLRCSTGRTKYKEANKFVHHSMSWAIWMVMAWHPRFMMMFFCSYYLNVNANTKRVKLSKEVGKQYFPVTDNQIEFWDLKWWRVVRHLTIHNKRISSSAVDLDEGW